MGDLKEFPTLKDLIHFFELKNSSLKMITEGIDPSQCIIVSNQTNRPGLNLFGFFKFFAYERLQIFGRGEAEYLKVLHKNHQLSNIENFFKYKVTGVLFSHGTIPPSLFLEKAEEAKVPVLISTLETSELINLTYDFFAEYLFIRQVVHGLMMEVFGTGVLIKSNSEIPRSETALELIERGHRFVSDDVVNIKLLKDKKLLAHTSSLISHHMEVKGIGIINIAHLFGVKSILKNKQVDLVIEMEKYDKSRDYDFIGNQKLTEKILDVEVPKMMIPFSYGGIIPVLIETATMNFRLKMTGYDPALEFNKKIIEYSNQKKVVTKKN